jgi:hypothetical protein
MSKPTFELVPMEPKEPLCFVTCLGCGHRCASDDPELVVDLGGPPFKAYYCSVVCFRNTAREIERRNA